MKSFIEFILYKIMFDLNYYESLKKCEYSDDIQCNKFRKMCRYENGKNCDFYTNNDIRNIINKANNQFEHFKEKFQNKEMTKHNYKLLTENPIFL